MKKVILSGILALGSQTLLAAPAAPMQWNGTGTLYDQDRNVESAYTVVVTVVTGAAGDAHTVVTVTGKDGSQLLSQVCDQKAANPNSWTKTCDDGGSGGGYLFDNGLGTDYYRAADGKAYATTIVVDGDSKMRMERVELDASGQPLHFYSETYTKAAQ